MKRKRSISIVLMTFLILLVISVAVGIIWAVIRNVIEPHFKIYEEECWNETTYTEIGQIDIPLIVLGLEEIPVIPNNAEFSCPTNSNICRIYVLENKSVCRQVEVDRIIMLNMDCIDEKYCGILKKYLTIEWLDENCEYSKCVRDGFVHNANTCCYDAGDFDGKKNVEIGEEYCDYKKVIEYKCGDYFVEVWNQIK